MYDMIQDYLENGITAEVKAFIDALDNEEQFELCGEVRELGWEWHYENQKDELMGENPFSDIYEYLLKETE